MPNYFLVVFQTSSAEERKHWQSQCHPTKVATVFSVETIGRSAKMGTTFVTLSHEATGTEPGFWMDDGMLELWLRLLALHLPEPTNDRDFNATTAIRNQWLIASRGYFGGCVPHCMEEACSTIEGRTVVRMAIDSLLNALRRGSTPLDAATLDLLGIERAPFASVERRWLTDIADAFIDLFDGKITCTAASMEVMPGTKPYQRR